MDTILKLSGLLVVATFLFLLFSATWKRREGLVHFVRRVFIVEITYLAVVIILALVFKVPGPVAFPWGIVAGLVMANRLPVRRERYIRASVRREVIARHELRTGKKFNSRTHELDHIIPFSKGGSHTADNLRVVEKAQNRSKGATNPWWDLFAR
jgi:HNH endonuclease